MCLCLWCVCIVGIHGYTCINISVYMNIVCIKEYNIIYLFIYLFIPLAAPSWHVGS